MRIQRVHRLGRRKRPGRLGQAFRHRHIIAAFTDMHDVELILSNAKRLKGRYGINRDYPEEIADARRDLYKELKQIESKA